MVSAIAGQGHLDRGDGVCRHLTDDNLCAIYETRPKECRIDQTCPPVMEMSEWFRRNEDACGRLHLIVYGTPIPR